MPQVTLTHACVPDEFVEQILNANDTGQKMYEDYVTVRTNGNISLWAKVTKVGYTMLLSSVCFQAYMIILIIIIVCICMVPYLRN